MRSFQIVSPAFAVFVFFSLVGFDRCQEAWSRTPAQSQNAAFLVEYLNRAAVKLDCYFTIEEMHLDVDNWIEAHHLQSGSEPSNIDKLVEELSSQLKGVHVYRSKENPTVVHIVDEQLEKEKDYSVAKRVAVKFRGTPTDLVSVVMPPTAP
jgi:hypothetical protein